MSTYEELIKQRNALDAQIKEVKDREKSEAVVKVKLLIDQHQLTAADLFNKKTSINRSNGQKVPPKYCNPATGETWTGRGKAPKWIDGKDRQSYLIG